MSKTKPVIALNLPETGLEPEIRDCCRELLEKLGFVPNVLKAYAFDNKKLKAFIDMVDDLMLGESGPLAAGAGNDRGRGQPNIGSLER